jgi:hypothetical protein
MSSDMSLHNPSGPIRLSPRFTEVDWREAFEGGERWDKAIDIVEDRIRGRWLRAGDILIREIEPGLGLAVLALDCVVIESMWGFMNGKPSPKKAQPVYREILGRPPFGFCSDQSDGFLANVRHGTIHDAETRARWIVAKASPPDAILRLNEHGGYTINRTRFHLALNELFGAWITELRNGDTALRSKMRERMNQIIKRHYGK